MFPILKVEIQSAVNYLKNLRTQTIVSLVIIALFAVIFLPLIIITMFNFLLLAEESILSSIMVMISVLIMIILSLITVNRIVKDMFMNENMQLYLTFPVKAVELLRAKFIMQLFTGILPVTIPIGLIVGVAFTFRYSSILPLVSAILYFMLLSILTLGLSYIIVFLVTKVASPKKVSEILTFIGGFAAVLPYLIITFGVVNIETVIKYLPNPAGLYEGFIYNVNLLEFTVFTLLSIILSIIIFVSLTQVVKNGFLKGWITTSGRSRKAGSTSLDVNSVKGALLQKDIKMTLRDFKEWAAVLPQYFIPFVVYFVAYNPVASDGYPEMNMDGVIISVSITGTVIISIFVSASNTARDARHYSMMRALPLKAADIVDSKFIYNFITIVPVYMLMSLGVFLFTDVSAAGLFYSLVFILMTALAVIPIGMWFGAKFPVVNTNKPTERMDTGASIIMMIVILILIFSTGFMSNVFIDADGDINHRMTGIMGVVMLALSAGIYFIVTKTVKNIYHRGLKIVYKG
ncbi:ABC transporter permease [Lacicoccus qingdaonensis]|uniref:ABC-2 type transport system permease protein n=1 Tax=Lacicoccus qingdaonensis TaxID=576118 RepID=A0A1G9FYE9_9BACL|nr:hypothetical protein [Salinicoccus qingdaonensis]SDK93471.1 ABC-2 type transport system permease protein [Salinicoccus qingdaonensis]